jgi:3-(3-hydroxy-phenyl)propionate hydroxylase
MKDQSVETTDVAVIGYGPVGEMAAVLLGMYGVRTAVFETKVAPNDQPRASTIDDEVMRIFEMAGLVPEMLPDMMPTKSIRWVAAKGKVLAEIPFEPGAVSIYGYATEIHFWQPKMEEVLRSAAGKFPHVSVHLGHEAIGVDQNADAITVTVRDNATGATRPVRAQYVLACDGGRSPVRHLADIGAVGSTDEHPWLVIDAEVKEPLKNLDALQLDVNPQRPSVNYPMPLGHHRWEFMVMPGEDREAIQQDDVVNKLISKYTDPAKIKILRKAVYVFHQRVAERWREGRLLFMGDAAHLMPPFLGQGMAAGVRDAANLCWKLAMVIKGTADPRVLDTYEEERRPHVEAMSEVSARNGKIIQATNPAVAFLRDSVFKTLNRIPAGHDYITHMDFKPVPVYETGLIDKDSSGEREPAAGALFIQPEVQTSTGERVLLDEVFGQGFAVIALGTGPARESADSPRSRDFWASLSTRFVQVLPAGATIDPQAAARPDTQVVVDVSGRIQAWLEEHDAQGVVVRPDRYVFGVFQADALAETEDKIRMSHLGE